MKTFLGAMAAFIAIMIGIHCYVGYLTDVSDKLEGYTNEILENASKSDWVSCKKAHARFSEDWHKTKKWFSAFIHHNDLSTIEETLSELEILIRYENKEQTAAKANIMKVLLKQLPENERFNIQNIL